MNDIDQLIADLRNATEGDYDLDVRIAKEIGIGICPRYTSGLDATEKALPPGWHWQHMHYFTHEKVTQWIARKGIDDLNGKIIEDAHPVSSKARSLVVLKVWKDYNGNGIV